MAMKSIKMTKAQTKVYDQGGIVAEHLMKCLRDLAELQCGPGDIVEIYTADGIVADYVEK